MNQGTLPANPEDALFGEFQIKYEIPNFLHQGTKAKITVMPERMYENQRFVYKFLLIFRLYKWLLLLNKKKLQAAYPQNLIKRSKHIGQSAVPGLSQETLSMMVEIVRIIRYKLTDKIPGLREAVLEAFDNFPLENEKFDLDGIGHVYFPNMWHSDLGEEIFAKFTANLSRNFSLSEAQKDRLQAVLKKRSDKLIFEKHAFNRLQKYYRRDPRHPDTEKACAAYNQAILDILKPAENKIGTYDLASLTAFLKDVLSDEALEKLISLIPDIYSEKGYKAMYEMYLKFQEKSDEKK